MTNGSDEHDGSAEARDEEIAELVDLWAAMFERLEHLAGPLVERGANAVDAFHARHRSMVLGALRDTRARVEQFLAEHT